MVYTYKKCHLCGKEFYNIEGRVFSNHIKWYHSEEKDIEKARENLRKELEKSNINRFGEKKNIVRKCDKCGKEYETLMRIKDGKQVPFSSKKGKEIWYKHNFCSSECSHSRENQKQLWTEEKRQEQSKKIKEKWLDEEFAKKAINNNRTIFSSKREREIVEHFRTKYKEDEWTFGPFLEVEGILLSVDLISKKLKIILEYDGVWHFENIKGQLKDKQYKDNLLEEAIKENGYRLIRIDEDENLDLEEIEDLIYNRDEQIIKIGDRYNNIELLQD